MKIWEKRFCASGILFQDIEKLSKNGHELVHERIRIVGSQFPEKAWKAGK
jgi:hypothetical protein